MKKFMKYVGITLLVIILVFFSLGLFVPSVSYESKVVVNKPVETSFGVFTNALKLEDWITGLKGIGWISGNQNEIGSKWKFIITRNGTAYEMVQTLDGFKTNELFAFKTDNDLFTNQADVKFINKGTSTEIIATSRLNGNNIFWRSVFFIGQSYLAAQDQEMYDKLKGVIEKEEVKEEPLP